MNTTDMEGDPIKIKEIMKTSKIRLNLLQMNFIVNKNLKKDLNILKMCW